MNETLNTIYNRRSIRSFKDEKISEHDLDLIIKAGTLSPSALNMQSGKIVVVKSEEVINLLREIGTSIFPKHVDPFYGAPNIILVLVKKDTFCPVQDGSVIMENMMLACRSLGIGSCWINCLNDILNNDSAKGIKKLIDEHDEYIGVAGMAFGYPKDDVWPEAKPRKNDYVIYL